MTPKSISALKPLNSVHIDLIGPYAKSIIKHQPGGAILKKDVNLTCMIMIDNATGCFEIFKVPYFNLEEVAKGNIKYIDKSYQRLNHILNKT